MGGDTRAMAGLRVTTALGLWKLGSGSVHRKGKCCGRQDFRGSQEFCFGCSF